MYHLRPARIFSIPGGGLVEGQLGEDAVPQPEPEQELVLVVRLQDCDTDPEELHKQVHLLFLAGLVLDLEALSIGVCARPAWWLSRAWRPVGPAAALVLG